MALYANSIIKKIPVKHRPLILVAASLSLCGIAFLSQYLYWLVFISLVPIFYYFKHFAPRRGLKLVLADFYLGGLLFSIIVLFWIAQADIGRWVAVSGVFEFLLKLISLLLTSAVYAAGFLVIGLSVYLLRKKPQAVFIAALPFVWALSEVARSYLFALFTYGPGASLAPYWNFGSLGLAGINSPIAFAARPLGLYGLSALVVGVNISVYMIFEKHYLKAAGLLVVVCGFSILGATVYAPTLTGRKLRVAAVHIGDSYGSLISGSALPSSSGKYDLVVLPEYSNFFLNGSYQTYAKSHYGTSSVILTSENDDKVPKHNRLLVYNTSNNSQHFYDKQLIIPGGETMPYSAIAFLKITGHSSVIDAFHDTQQVSRGAFSLPLIRENGVAIGPSVCSSIINPFFGVSYKRQGSSILTNSASLIFLDKAPTYHVQERYMLRFQAISSAQPLIHASRTGTSLIIDANGRVIAQSSDGLQTQVLTADLGI